MKTDLRRAAARRMSCVRRRFVALGGRLRAQRRRPSGGLIVGAFGASLVVSLLALAILAPVLTPYGPLELVETPNLPPSGEHLLGTNDLGQDIFTRLLFGTRLSLTIGVLSAVFATALGLIVALGAGYFGGAADALLMRGVDVTLALPFIPLVIVLAAFFGRGLLITVLVIAAVIWAWPARVLRSQVLKVREFQHVSAARAMGATPRRIMIRHILPRTGPLVAAQFVRATNVAVMIEASLAFLGLGDPQRVSWGTMLFFANSNNAMLTEAWMWWVLPPGLALTALVVGFALVGYALEEWGDRRLVGGSPQSSTWGRGGEGTGGSGASRTHVELQSRWVLVVHELEVSYDGAGGAARAVDGVSFKLARGRVTGLVGESGCGKSTLAMALLGLSRPPARVMHGWVAIDGGQLQGRGVSGAERVRGRKIGFIPQSSMNALNPAYTVHKQIAETAALTRSPDEARDRADELLETVGLLPSNKASYSHELSGGMRQRVVIAMALANNPAIVVADEPLTGLDVVTQEKITRLLLDLQSRLGIALLLISHDLPVVGGAAHDLLVMYAGRIVESGSAAEVMGDPLHPYTRELLRAFPTMHGPRGRLPTLRGEPPNLIEPPPGCRFHPRCPVALEQCAVVDPPAVEATSNHHYAACVLVGDRRWR